MRIPTTVTSITLTVLLCAKSAASYDELPNPTKKTLDDGKAAVAVRQTWQEYHDQYAHASSGEAERADREQKWSALEAYAKQLRILQQALKAGDSIADYPGILAHGTIHWNPDNKTYELTLGLRPFDAGDGLGQFTVTFDPKGIVSEVRVHKYKW